MGALLMGAPVLLLGRSEALQAETLAIALGLGGSKFVSCAVGGSSGGEKASSSTSFGGAAELWFSALFTMESATSQSASSVAKSSCISSSPSSSGSRATSTSSKPGSGCSKS